MQSKIGIIGAMDVEVKTLKSLLENPAEKKVMGLTFVEGLLEGKEVVIVQSGIGKVNAALCTQILIWEFKVSRVINTGIAGAMAQGLKVLDFVVSTDCLYHDMDASGFGYKKTQIPQMECSDFLADSLLVKTAEEAFSLLKEAEGHSLLAGRIASGDQFVSSKEVKALIKENCNPACVEMEGAAIAHAAYLNKVPFVIIRCMSDMADDSGENVYSFNEEAAADLSAALVREIVKRI